MAWSPLPDIVDIEIHNPEPREFTLDPAKTAVVVVDMQKISLSSQRSRDIIPGNELLLQKAREAGAKVIYIQSLRQLESHDFTLFGMKPYRLPGTEEVEIMDELAPQPGEPVIQKWSNDVFAWWGIEEVLEKEGVVAGEWTVLVTGVSAIACAEAASLGFSNRMYRTVVPLDTQAANIEGESRIFALYAEPEYANRMGFTLSSLVTFQSPALEQEQEILVPVT